MNKKGLILDRYYNAWQEVTLLTEEPAALSSTTTSEEQTQKSSLREIHPCHRLNMEVDLQSLFGLVPITRALLVSKDRRHLFVTPWPFCILAISNNRCGKMDRILIQKLEYSASVLGPEKQIPPLQIRLQHVLWIRIWSDRHILPDTRRGGCRSDPDPYWIQPNIKLENWNTLSKILKIWHLWRWRES